MKHLINGEMLSNELGTFINIYAITKACKRKPILYFKNIPLYKTKIKEDQISLESIENDQITKIYKDFLYVNLL